MNNYGISIANIDGSNILQNTVNNAEEALHIEDAKNLNIMGNMLVLSRARGVHVIQNSSGSVSSNTFQENSMLKKIVALAITAGFMSASFAQAPSAGPAAAPVAVNEVVRDMVRFAEFDARAHSVQFVLELTEPLRPVQADQVQLEQVIGNLVKNGIEAMAESSGERVLTIRTQDRKSVV